LCSLLYSLSVSLSDAQTVQDHFFFFVHCPYILSFGKYEGSLHLIFFLQPNSPDSNGSFFLFRHFPCREPEEISVYSLENYIVCSLHRTDCPELILILQLCCCSRSFGDDKLSSVHQLDHTVFCDKK